MANETLQSTEAVIDALGGTAAVASLLDCKLNAVSNWKKAATFPARTYVALSQALITRGKHAPASLWNMSVPETAA